MGETMAVEGSTDRWVFEAYVEHALAPALRDGQVVIMDNLPAHKPARVRDLLEERGCELIYLPAYSPDLNPMKKRLASSRTCYVERELEPRRPCWRYWAKRFRQSAPETLEVTSSMLAIAHKSNYCETCCDP
jgi:transposase